MTSLTLLRRIKIKDKEAGLTEPSGLALVPGAKGYWTVSDDTRRIFRLTRKGRVRSGHSLRVPVQGLEGIATDTSGRNLFVVKEETSEILKIRSATGRIVQRCALSTLDGYEAIAPYFADGPDNKGLEGVAWRPGDEALFLLKEAHPGLLIEVTPALDRVVGWTVLDRSRGFVDHTEDRPVDFSDLCFDVTRRAFWIVSDQASRVFLYDPEAGAVRESYPLAYEKNGRLREVPKAEGVAHDAATDQLHIVSDETARLYVFALIP